MDGFHGIISIFQAISLADEIIVRSLKQQEHIEIKGTFDCPPEKTTFYKAAMAFREATGEKGGLSVTVDKVIPAGAGLGGGSSDAAAFLHAVNALFETGLSETALLELGAKVGSDVPFFIRGGTALVTGRGDLVEKMETRVDYACVVVYPGFAVRTREAFDLLDRERPEPSLENDIPPRGLMEAYRESITDWPFANSFERHIARAHPEIGYWIGKLKESGADFARMSGSGSALFGIFMDRAKALKAVRELSLQAGAGFLVASAFPLARPSGLI